MKSIWMSNVNINSFEQLNKDARTDVLIIGGGIAGLMCAYYLKQAGADYILVEGARIGGGVTQNTTAKIISQHGLIYSGLIKSCGLEKAGKYLAANQLAVSELGRLCESIPCDFEWKSAFVYSLRDRKAVEKEVSAVNKLGLDAQFSQNIPLPFDIAGAIKFENQAQFNPLKFIAGISKGLNIYENTFVKEIGEHTAVTDNGKITAKNIIIATHFPFLNKHGSYFLKMYQHRSYAIALENAPNVNGMYLEETENGMSFRNYDNMLIIGGGDHRTGKSGECWHVLRDFAKNAFPNANEKYAWATQDCITLDNIPYIGNYSKSTNGLYVATGFNKWGMTSSVVSAMILTDIIQGKTSQFADVFSPSRSMLKPRLFFNGCAAVSNLISFSKKRCPHMGCALKWNSVEHSWDCPCHGSRFERDGKLLDNPATRGIKIK